MRAVTSGLAVCLSFFLLFCFSAQANTACPYDQSRLPSSINSENANALAKCGIIVAQDDPSLYRYGDTILRQEVIGMAVKMRKFNLPPSYSCQNYFFDVSQSVPNSWICRATEIAADNFVVSRENGHLRPTEQVTKSEALALMLAGVCMRPVSATQASIAILSQGYTFQEDAVDWQRRTMMRYMEISSLDTSSFRPNACASRAEVFDFATRLLDYSTTEGQCRSSICDIVDTLQYASGEEAEDGFLTNIISVEELLAQARSVGGIFANVQTVEELSQLLASNFEVFENDLSFREILETIADDRLLASSETFAEMLQTAESYTVFVRNMQSENMFEDVDTIQQFVNEIQKIPRYEDIHSIGSFIKKLQKNSSYKHVGNVEDLEETLKNYTRRFDTFPSLIGTTVFASFLDEGFDASNSDLDDIENLISDQRGFESVDTVPEFINKLSSAPGFADVRNGGDLSILHSNYKELENFKQLLGAVGLARILDDRFNAMTDTLRDLVTIIQEDDEFSHIHGIEDFIEELKQKPNLGSIESLDDFQAITQDYTGSGDVELIISGAELGALLDDNFNITEDGLKGLMDRIQKTPGFEHVDTVDEFLEVVRQKLPGFENVYSLNEFGNVLRNNYAKFDTHAEKFAAAQLKAKGELFEDIDSPSDIVEVFAEESAFEDNKTLDEVVEDLSEHAAFSHVENFPELVQAMGEYPEFQDIESVPEIMDTIKDYDMFVDELTEFSVFSGADTTSALLDTMNDYPGFEEVDSVSSLIDTLKDKYENVFDEGDSIDSIISKFDDINRLLEAIQLD